MTTGCDSAAAYVLGALAAGERSDFETHLAQCTECRQSVGELAGIPGLLSRVSVDDLAHDMPVPDTLVPGLLRAVRRSGRRRRVAVGALSAAAVVLAITGTVLVVNRGDAPVAPVATAMTAVAPSPVSASVALVSHRWGTAITMTCRYAEDNEWSRPYDLVAVDDTGTSYDIATWVVGPGKTASISGSVPVSREHIDRLEIRATSGTPLLRLSP
jgi:anti-sigma-K factor RskA